jgi:DNA modification methylase
VTPANRSWGLRDYDLPPVVWGGDPDCQHRWDCRGRDAWAASPPGRSSRLAMVALRGSAGHNGGRFCLLCSAWLGSLGLEPTPELYVEHLVDVFRQLRRVLKPTGTLWLNLGDSYFTRSVLRERGNRDVIKGCESQVLPDWRDYVRRGRVRYSSRHATLQDKDLVGVPWRVAFALQAQGWYLRSDVIWAKPNPMPESVRDRPTRAHEYLFLFSINRRYYIELIRVGCCSRCRTAPP